MGRSYKYKRFIYRSGIPPQTRSGMKGGEEMYAQKGQVSILLLAVVTVLPIPSWVSVPCSCRPGSFVVFFIDTWIVHFRLMTYFFRDIL
jgi:hypothetical protein